MQPSPELPVAREGDAIFTNVNIISNPPADHPMFCRFPKCILAHYILSTPVALITTFCFWLYQIPEYPIFFWLFVNGAILKDQFYCPFCGKMLSSGGGSTDISRHYRVDMQKNFRLNMLVLPHSFEYSFFIDFVLSHEIHFSCFKDVILTQVFGFHGYDVTKEFLNLLEEAVLEIIAYEISQVGYLRLSTDGWSNVHRYIGIRVTYILNGKLISRFLGLIYLGADHHNAKNLVQDIQEISAKITAIQKRMGVFDGHTLMDKIIVYGSDNTNLNPAIARVLGVDFDGCLIHGVSLDVEYFMGLLDAEFPAAIKLSTTSKTLNHVACPLLADYLEKNPSKSCKLRNVATTVDTRFLTVLKCLSSGVDLEQDLKNFESSTKTDLAIPGDVAFAIARAVVECFVPFERIFTSMQGGQMTFPKIVILMNDLYHAIERFPIDDIDEQLNRDGIIHGTQLCLTVAQFKEHFIHHFFEPRIDRTAKDPIGIPSIGFNIVLTSLIYHTERVRPTVGGDLSFCCITQTTINSLFALMAQLPNYQQAVNELNSFCAVYLGHQRPDDETMNREYPKLVAIALKYSVYTGSNIDLESDFSKLASKFDKSSHAMKTSTVLERSVLHCNMDLTDTLLIAQSEAMLQTVDKNTADYLISLQLFKKFREANQMMTELIASGNASAKREADLICMWQFNLQEGFKRPEFGTFPSGCGMPVSPPIGTLTRESLVNTLYQPRQTVLVDENTNVDEDDDDDAPEAELSDIPDFDLDVLEEIDSQPPDDFNLRVKARIEIERNIQDRLSAAMNDTHLLLWDAEAQAQVDSGYVCDASSLIQEEINASPTPVYI